MRWSLFACTVFAVGSLTAMAQSAAPPCHVTTTTDPGGRFGNAGLSVGPFGVWRDGNVIFRPGGPGFQTHDGSLGMKFGWTQGVAGQLKIEGRRLDGSAPPLRVEIGSSNPETGFSASALVFSTPGCWEVTGRVESGKATQASVTFITLVTKIGDGPADRREIR